MSTITQIETVSPVASSRCGTRSGLGGWNQSVIWRIKFWNESAQRQRRTDPGL